MSAKFVGKTAWKVHLGTLTKGHWRFSAVVTDKAGKKATSNVVTENINVGLAAERSDPGSCPEVTRVRGCRRRSRAAPCAERGRPA